MKKILSLAFIFLAAIFIFSPRPVLATGTLYEVTVNINSLKIPERGVLITDTTCAGYGVGGVYDCRNAEMRIRSMDSPLTDVTIKEGEVIKAVKSFNTTPYLNHGSSVSGLVFTKESGVSYDVYVHLMGYTVPTDDTAYANCMVAPHNWPNSKMADLQYESSPGTWVDAVCSKPPMTRDGVHGLYVGESANVYFNIYTTDG